MSFDPMDLTYGRAIGQSRQATIAGRVMGLLGFSLLFTAGGYLVGRPLGAAGMLISIIGSLACVFALSMARAKMSSIVALGVFYLFSVFEGMALGLIIDSYLQRGMGTVVVNASVTTSALVLMLSAYAWTTKRDLSGMATYLMVGLMAVILAGLVGIVLSFFGMYDMQRLRYAREGVDDPIMLAVSIYLSIFNLFLAILRIFGYLQSSNDD
jgi:modulator of FtsH protease